MNDWPELPDSQLNNRDGSRPTIECESPQHPNRRRLLLLAYMAISVHSKPDIAMASQGLGRLRRHVRTAEVRDEGVPHGVEVVTHCSGNANPYLILNSTRIDPLTLSNGDSHLKYCVGSPFRSTRQTNLLAGGIFSQICKKYWSFLGAILLAMSFIVANMRVVMVR